MSMIPKIGNIVLVTTHGRTIGGQVEHAAIVTKVLSAVEGGSIAATVFTADGRTLPLGSVMHESTAASRGNLSALDVWRWPPA